MLWEVLSHDTPDFEPRAVAIDARGIVTERRRRLASGDPRGGFGRPLALVAELSPTDEVRRAQMLGRKGNIQ